MNIHDVATLNVCVSRVNCNFLYTLIEYGDNILYQAHLVHFAYKCMFAEKRILFCCPNRLLFGAFRLYVHVYMYVTLDLDIRMLAC